MGTRVYHAVRRLIAARIGPQRAAVPVASNSTGGTNVDRNARESTTSHGRDGICGLIAISLWLAVAFGCVPGAVHCVTDLGQVDVQGRLVRADGLPVAGIDIELRLIPSASDTAYSGALLTAAAPSDNGGFLHHVLSFRGGFDYSCSPPDVLAETIPSEWQIPVPNQLELRFNDGGREVTFLVSLTDDQLTGFSSISGGTIDVGTIVLVSEAGQ